ncbi:MAG: TetR family transcriptional regulator [Gammaproteobacteria bacterium]|nr:TetR family transcriptional regulator [Gammaproteobacteria bacterium]
MTSAATLRQPTEKKGLRRIMLAARDEFCRAGLAGAKLDVIAMQAEVSKQLIHHYFRTKTELYVAVVDEISALMIDELSRPSYEELPPVEALRLYFHGVFDVLVRWPFAAGLFIDESLYEAEHLPSSLSGFRCGSGL